jgi:hypothetical protein
MVWGFLMVGLLSCVCVFVCLCVHVSVCAVLKRSIHERSQGIGPGHSKLDTQFPCGSFIVPPFLHSH